jgi:hypothetical protein
MGPIGGVIVAIINSKLTNIAQEKKAKGWLLNSNQPSRTHIHPESAFKGTACINVP